MIDGELVVNPTLREAEENSELDLIVVGTLEGLTMVEAGAKEVSEEVILEALSACRYTAKDLDLLIPHQANLRISQMVAMGLELREDQVFNNIDRYGNTTAASIPLALYEAIEQRAVKPGALICLAAFGAGFTWASALLRW